MNERERESVWVKEIFLLYAEFHHLSVNSLLRCYQQSATLVRLL